MVARVGMTGAMPGTAVATAVVGVMEAAATR